MKAGVTHATFPHLHLGLGTASYVAKTRHAKSQALFPGWSNAIPNLYRLGIKVEQVRNDACS